MTLQPLHSRLLSSEEEHAFRLRVWYDCLNAHPPFAADLQALYLRAGSEVGLSLSEMPRETWERLDQFARHWRLPSDRGLTDLHHALWWTWRVNAGRRAGSPPQPVRLEVSYWGGPVPSVGQQADELRARGFEPPDDGAARWPIVVPPPLAPFRYDPTSGIDSPATARTKIKEMLAAAEREMLEQVEAFEAQATGYRPLPWQWRDPETTPPSVKYLFRRVVQQQPWQTIAEAHGVSVATVKTVVLEWAEALRLPLPKSRPGRPAKRKL